MLNKNLISESLNLIINSKKITLLTHFRPDADGISACVALENIFLEMGKNIETVLPCKPEFELKRMPKKYFINKHEQDPDLIIALDTANYERLYFPESFRNKKFINIDHHVSNSLNSDFNFINPDSSSTCEILFEIINIWEKDLNKKLINKYTAECLLFGILYDSMIFHTQSTYPSTLNISAKLMELGANLYDLKTELICNKNPNIIIFWGKILSNIKISKSKKAAWAKITQQDLKENNLSINSLVGFNNFLSQISGIEYTLLFYQTENGQTKVSLRSKTEDVNKLATPFGGGGHTNAAGILSNEPIDILIEKITKNL